MDLVSMITNEKQPIEIILLKYFEMDSTVMGFHEYQNKWTLLIGEFLETQMELTNETDKYAVAVLKNENVVGHLPKEKTGKYVKSYLLFKVRPTVHL